jgi:hypothetical protein
MRRPSAVQLIIAVQRGAPKSLGLLFNWLNTKDKQNYRAALALADIRLRKAKGGGSEAYAVTTLRDAMQGAYFRNASCIAPADCLIVPGFPLIYHLPCLAAPAEVPEYWGNYLFTELCHRYTRIFVIKGRTPAECVCGAAFVITMLGRWKQSLKDQPRQPDGSPKVIQCWPFS